MVIATSCRFLSASRYRLQSYGAIEGRGVFMYHLVGGS